MPWVEDARIEWVCPECQSTHHWNWPDGDDGPITMVCEKECGAETKGDLVYLGGHRFSFVAHGANPK